MAAPRLPFLWPMLMRSVETGPTLRSAQSPATRIRASHTGRRAIHSINQRRQETIAQRYGSANEPTSHLGGEKSTEQPMIQGEEEQTKLPKIGEKLQKDRESQAQDGGRAKRVEDSRKDVKQEPTTIDGAFAMPAPSPIGRDPMLDTAESQPEKEPPDDPDPQLPTDKILETILESVPDPTQTSRKALELTKPPAPEEDDQHAASFDEHTPSMRAPHIDPPRYVHHFDTYSLVQRLVEGGWNENQAITTMKAVRRMLNANIGLATDALVSKSNVENETYLFRAACAELKTEVTARRGAEQEKMRTERTRLQHEVEILGQRMTQESGMLKDDLKGMFDDRKMAVRNEQRGMESKVQQLNYQITVELQADAKSDVEGLRWVMTRRVIIALFAIVIMVVGGLKVISNLVHEQDLEAKRRANMKSGGTQTSDEHLKDSYGGNHSNGNGNGVRREPDIKADEMLVKEGDNPGFVSLG